MALLQRRIRLVFEWEVDCIGGRQLMVRVREFMLKRCKAVWEFGGMVGKMSKDVGMAKVLWCHSYLVWLLFGDSIPTCCFISLK